MFRRPLPLTPFPLSPAPLASGGISTAGFFRFPRNVGWVVAKGGKSRLISPSRFLLLSFISRTTTPFYFRIMSSRLDLQLKCAKSVFFFLSTKKKDIYSYYVYLLDFLRFFLLYCFFNDNFPRLFRIIHHSSSWFAFISTPILCILFINYLYKMYLYLCKRIRFIMCRFLYRFDSSQSSLTLSLSHAKYTVFIFRPSKSYTVLNNCRRIYIYLLYILSQYLQVIHFSR